MMKPWSRKAAVVAGVLLAVPAWVGTLLLGACAAGEGAAVDGLVPAPTPFQTEIVVRTPANFRSDAEVTAFVAMAARNQVAVISVLVKQDEDSAIPSGQVFYSSKLAPPANGYQGVDVLQQMVMAAHPLGIRVRAWVPQFHDQTAARLHPQWQMMAYKEGQVLPYTGAHQTEYFVNPLDPGVQQYQLALLKEIADNYPVDGIMLDWLRFDDFNMDLGPATRLAYQTSSGVDPLTIDFSTASLQRDSWNNFRTEGIASYVRNVRSSLPASVALGVYLLPPEFVEVGQDAARFNTLLTQVAPMCYFRDWKFAIDWVWNSCLPSTAAKAGHTAVVPTMDSGLSDEQYHQILLHLRRDYPQVSTLAWFYHDRWTEDMLKRIALIRTW